jgi:hypothetical protein
MSLNSFHQLEEARRVEGIHRVGQPDVTHAGGDEHFSFADLRAADSDSSALNLPPGDKWRFVGLRMRSQPETCRVRQALRGVDVLEQPTTVHDDLWRGQIIQHHAGTLPRSPAGNRDADGDYPVPEGPALR